MGYMQVVNPEATVVAGPLTNPKVWWAGGRGYGGACCRAASQQRCAGASGGWRRSRAPGRLTAQCGVPGVQEPPLCAVDPEFDAIVVSEETVPGAHAINQVGGAGWVWVPSRAGG